MRQPPSMMAGLMRSESSLSSAPSFSSTLRIQATPSQSSLRSKPADSIRSVKLFSSRTEKPRARKERRAKRNKVSEGGTEFRKDPDVEEEEPRPKLDRTTDLIVSNNFPFRPASYRKVAAPLSEENNQCQRLFMLPSTIRRRIYGLCFPEEPRPVTVSPSFATRHVFGEGYFAQVWDVLEDVRGGLESFRFLRKDLLTFFWSEYHFHVTINAFTGPKLSPLSHIWLPQHVGSIKNLTVEIDYTRLGGSCRRLASTFGYNRDKEDRQLTAIFEGLADRKDGSSIDALTILCRRFAGFQPHNDSKFRELLGKAPVPYCPESVLGISSYIQHVEGKVRQLRVAGYPLGYTKDLLNVFSMSIKNPRYPELTTGAWPPLPPPPKTKENVVISTLNTPMSSFSSTFSGLNPPSVTPSPTSTASHTNTNTATPTPTPSAYRLDLKRSPSLVEEFQNGLRRQDSPTSESDYSNHSNYTITNDENTLVEETEDMLLAASHPSQTNHAQQYQNLVGPFTVSDQTNEGHLFSSNTTHSYSPATPRSKTMGDLRSATGSIRSRMAKPSVRFDRQTPSPPSRVSTPKTPNGMNERNEQDPAFVRSVSALRSIDLPPKEPVKETAKEPASIFNLGLGLDFMAPILPSVFTSPEPFLRATSVQGLRRSSSEQTTPVRCTTSMSMAALKRASVKKKCVNFYNKLRGRTSETAS